MDNTRLEINSCGVFDVIDLIEELINIYLPLK